ncbi:ARK protein kinase family [Aspergillus indologenus CBS 114.80]|uniref:non-specific serine/threonine protein kinase n=1 Tax=Aspergillus indologenus CBS 114.80 TaxID=1450541 RepID=A0A2V5HWC4_9EURO|nr:ARK protein kinase family [Aspergillus indologenus CBS 114.80]
MSSQQPNPASYQSHAAPHLPIPVYNPVAAIAAPAGTFLPGTKVQVGSHRVVVEKYLSEGGFAHVYVVRLPQPVDGSDRAVLKRVAVPDKSALANMRTEVETMKKLKGHRHIVTYIDSHASQLRGGGYEVFLLMEFCDGGGLIDFMNTRLQNRLTEPEIIKIFSDVAEGVACMHYLKPPLLHRDLKVENVLISRQGRAALYKLCDFGSAAPPRPAATSAAEGRLIEDDVQRHTTLQYRSPEMIDVYRKQPIDEKSDIWALGVLLYKLCYYTTPFEEVGQMAILNASYKFPSYPAFSDRLKMLIAWMLKELPQKRPNIYEVVREVCHMQGKDVPISDIYAARSTSEARRYQELPPSPTEAPQVGAVFSPPVQETQIIPEIAPMRRGRPTRPTQSPHHSAKPSPSPFRGSGDPFSVLDNAQRPRDSADEFTNRFPSLDQFQILHEKGGKFDFESAVPESSPEDDDLARRLTNALADDAFAKHQSPGPEGSASQRPTQPPSTQSAPVERVDNARDEGRASVPLYQPAPQRPTMVSTGTMTSPPPTPGVADYKPSSRPVYKFPPADHQRRPSSHKQPSESDLKAKAPSPSTNAVVQPRGSSDRISDLSASPRPSLEGGRPSNLEVGESAGRSRSANGRSRPVSVHAGARYELPRGSESARSSLDLPRPPYYEGGAPLQHARTEADSLANISSDVDYLRAREEESNKKRDKRYSGTAKHGKRSSLSTLSLSGTKMFAGRFGDAFRRFEHSNSESKVQSPVTEEAPSKPPMMLTSADLTSEPASELIDMDGNEDISPEMRRELERRRLSQEEKRVANAAAEYRRRVAEGGQAGAGAGAGGWRDGPRSQAIQNKVQSLLGESARAPPPPKTATGYGRYTDETAGALPAKPTELRSSRASAPAEQPTSIGKQPTASGRPGSSSGGARPALPPKPKSLRMPTGMEGQAGSQDRSPTVAATPASAGGEDWEASFSRRFPSLSGLEMETEIELPRVAPQSLRTKEV